MRVSASIELIWKLAAQEAMAADFKEVEPEHFLEALLKFSELPVEEMDKIAHGGEAARILAEEVNVVREELEARSIDTSKARRALRERLGQGPHKYDGRKMHRSQASRDLFDASARLSDDAGSDTLTALHFLQAILEAPTSIMVEVLGDADGLLAARPSKTPLLDEWGRDLSRLAVEGQLPAVSDRKAECKALMQALGGKERKSVLLVGEDKKSVRSVVLATADAMARKDAPRGLRRRHIMDISSMDVDGRDRDEIDKRLNAFLAEAVAAEDVILYMPGVGSSSDSGGQDWWHEFLKSALVRGGLQCICRMDPAVYDEAMQKDPAWRQRVQVMWVHEAKAEDLPDEL